MLDWLGKMLDLPAEFLACSGGKGGGVIQGTASEATLVALLGAKAKMMKKVKEEHPDWEDSIIVPKLVGYCSGMSRKFYRIKSDKSELLSRNIRMKTVILVFSRDLSLIIINEIWFFVFQQQLKPIQVSSVQVCWVALNCVQCQLMKITSFAVRLLKITSERISIMASSHST